MGRYGNIDGIATLTNNPNATDNAKGTIGKLLEYYMLKDTMSIIDEYAIKRGNPYDREQKD